MYFSSQILNMKATLAFVVLFSGLFVLNSCVTVRQGTVGVKRSIGKIKEGHLQAGAQWYNPFVSRIIVVPVRTENIEVKLELPSKEGLNVNAEISILYHIEADKATQIVADIGMDYEQTLILPVFRASAADVTAKNMAKDMHTGNRLGIEKEIKERMSNILTPRGFQIEAVLLKSIQLPPGLYKAIEEKLEAEQQSQRMEFILTKEKQEAERRIIEAQGIRDANKIISEGLTPQIIQYKAIEAYRELSTSPNAKVIIGSGNQPLIINPE